MIQQLENAFTLVGRLSSIELAFRAKDVRLQASLDQIKGRSHAGASETTDTFNAEIAFCQACT